MLMTISSSTSRLPGGPTALRTGRAPRHGAAGAGVSHISIFIASTQASGWPARPVAHGHGPRRTPPATGARARAGVAPVVSGGVGRGLAKTKTWPRGQVQRVCQRCIAQALHAPVPAVAQRAIEQAANRIGRSRRRRHDARHSASPRARAGAALARRRDAGSKAATLSGAPRSRRRRRQQRCTPGVFPRGGRCGSGSPASAIWSISRGVIAPRGRPGGRAGRAGSGVVAQAEQRRVGQRGAGRRRMASSRSRPCAMNLTTIAS